MTQSRKRRNAADASAAETIEIPDFGLVLLSHRSETRAIAETAAAAHAPRALVAATSSLDIDAVDAAFADRGLVLLLTPSDAMNGGAVGDALASARERLVPITTVRFGDAARPPAGVDTISARAEAPVALSSVRVPSDRRDDAGPFDIIGDVHGCFDELVDLLRRLGWRVPPWRAGDELLTAQPPVGRKALFVGDITDRGPRNADALRLVMGMTADGVAAGVCGNHDHKLRRLLEGADVTRSHGLAETEEELRALSPQFRTAARDHLAALPDHLWLDDGGLVVAHAGLRADMHGRVGKPVRKFALFGDVTGERDAYGLPVRLDWAADYTGEPAVVYGHTPRLEAQWRFNTLCVDTGCCFGGKLTAVRWPEREIVSIPAARAYSAPIKPLDAA